MHPLAYFPESMFPPQNRDTYLQKVYYGYDEAQHSSCCIVGCCRNIESSLSQVIFRLEALGKLFRTYHVFIYENNSTDQTKQWLFSPPGFTIIKEDLIDYQSHDQDKSLIRRQNMARCRNKCLDFALKMNYKWTIVADLDTHGWSYEGVLNSLGHNKLAIGSNGILYREINEKHERLYYDTWAYRKDSWDEEDATNQFITF